jgi:hypothetical protein
MRGTSAEKDTPANSHFASASLSGLQGSRRPAPSERTAAYEWGLGVLDVGNGADCSRGDQLQVPKSAKTDPRIWRPATHTSGRTTGSAALEGELLHHRLAPPQAKCGGPRLERSATGGSDETIFSVDNGQPAHGSLNCPPRTITPAGGLK